MARDVSFKDTFHHENFQRDTQGDPRADWPDLEAIPNVGASIARDLRSIGIKQAHRDN